MRPMVAENWRPAEWVPSDAKSKGHYDRWVADIGMVKWPAKGLSRTDVGRIRLAVMEMEATVGASSGPFGMGTEWRVAVAADDPDGKLDARPDRAQTSRVIDSAVQGLFLRVVRMATLHSVDWKAYSKGRRPLDRLAAQLRWRQRYGLREGRKTLPRGALLVETRPSQTPTYVDRMVRKHG